MRRQTTYQEATPASLMKLLQSDKAKERSSGRKGLEQLLQLDKRREKLTTKEYSDMLRACITFENHEIHAAVKSIRAYYDTNNALFFKSVCKAHHAYGNGSAILLLRSTLTLLFFPSSSRDHVYKQKHACVFHCFH